VPNRKRRHEPSISGALTGSLPPGRATPRCTLNPCTRMYIRESGGSLCRHKKRKYRGFGGQKGESGDRKWRRDVGHFLVRCRAKSDHVRGHWIRIPEWMCVGTPTKYIREGPTHFPVWIKNGCLNTATLWTHIRWWRWSQCNTDFGRIC
jgi:hypothetical protein